MWQEKKHTLITLKIDINKEKRLLLKHQYTSYNLIH